MIYEMAYQILNYLLIILLHFQLYMIQTHLLLSQTVTWIKSMIGSFNGKWFSIQIAASKFKKQFAGSKLKTLTSEEHLKDLFNKTNKTIRLSRMLSNLLPRQVLVTIYKAFVRPHIDYVDVLYDKAFNNLFHTKMKSIQSNAYLAITGAIWGLSKEKIYQESGLEPLSISSLMEKTLSLLRNFQKSTSAILF